MKNIWLRQPPEPEGTFVHEATRHLTQIVALQLGPLPLHPPDDAGLRARLRELADQRRRFGYRRLHVLLRLEGHALNRKKTQRLYHEEGLAVRRRKSRRRIAVARTPIPAPEGPNSRWSVDFVHDQLADGRRFRVLNIIDDVTKECLAAVADTSLSGKRVARELEALIARRGRPSVIVSDNGTEFTSSAVLKFTQEHKVDWRYIAPGKPTQNAFAESFQGRMRDGDRIRSPSTSTCSSR
jgi:putative transposase